MARLAIVGAGPAGAASAYLLARRGIDVTLLEVRADFVIGCDGRS
jgi:2-polyprenyl-6-methoxyphenol hydroxylase-like FAD-dependent oxidoreductase